MKSIKKYAIGGAPCPDCKLTQDASGSYKYGSDSTGYTTSSDREIAKKKHRYSYPESYSNSKQTEKPKVETPQVQPYKKGGAVTALNKVQEMYSKKKK
jgi:hypothetical protein